MMADPAKRKVLLVCMGNICRSPIAEGVLRKVLENSGLAKLVDVDSAGTHGYHVGEPPDPRAIAVAGRRGYDIKALRARRVRRDDFSAFDLVLAMDRENLANLLEICPPVYQSRVKLLLSYSRDIDIHEVPDPYYGGEAGFEAVLAMVENAALGLVEALRREDL
jgi:protein-tyrosine phosphatase